MWYLTQKLYHKEYIIIFQAQSKKNQIKSAQQKGIYSKVHNTSSCDGIPNSPITDRVHKSCTTWAHQKINE